MKVKSLWMNTGIKLVLSPSRPLHHMMQNMRNRNKKSKPSANQSLLREAHMSLMKWRLGIHPVCMDFKSMCSQKADVKCTSALLPGLEIKTSINSFGFEVPRSSLTEFWLDSKLNSSATETTEQLAMSIEGPSNSSGINETQHDSHEEQKSVLISLYSIVFVGGVIGASAMLYRILKNDKNSKSFIIINLSVAHVIFLITVPFRISYYIIKQWKFGLVFCKLVSAVIHIHIYLTFVLYVIIIITRFRNVFQKRENLKTRRPWIALVLSVVLWVVATVIIFPIFLINYGVKQRYNESQCFHFEAEISSKPVRIVNYILICTTICTVTIMLIWQISIMLNLAIKHGSQTHAHQVFRAQLKSLTFILIMFVFFVPYLGFRIYYIKRFEDNSSIMHLINEIGLSITGMSCFDLLIFWIWYSL
ncbi:probable G-protein coupled receptor 141 isoform X1 [Carcharodon carcharias]|uniref:probable G-protein coupled receptor 141 isoform X1 n=1 Tax=Carcharodon carcharias TaxID=13397 RepID=UPI001B7F23BA|nr:probable G-protein coupled receptor 141 isoform X1 [Carcharodon carcharias]